MSIIFGTLERLESGSPSPTRAQQLELPSPIIERKRFPVMGLITTLLFVMAVANLVLWYWSSQGGLVSNPVLTPVDSQIKTVMAPVKGQSAESMGEKSAVSLPAIVPNEKEIVPVNLSKNEETSAARKLAISEPQTSVKKPAIEKSVTNNSVKSYSPPALTPDPSPVKTRSASMTTVPVSEPARQESRITDIEHVIEDARLALSRGRYQQALGHLDTLESVPETRADFWLLKGSAYLAIGQLDAAETALETAQSGAPYNAQIGVQRAILKQEKGDHKAALEILEPMAYRHQNIPEIFLNQGYSQQALGAERAAQRSFRVFLRLTAGRSLYDQQRRAIQDWLAPAPPATGDPARQ